ncbi:uncharacterized protein LOC122365009 [Amphibalanus amphitrite]|uniref:uncharacterized protein LOC122365009 n=1 Tax=Amphibalanus amphitrite TaxID=1232801 RepID=UPI001C90AF2C|nr:uncharacterized protein LOC122365009 [Amphibalanus amphitrite]
MDTERRQRLYVAFQSGAANYTFDVPMTACGSRAIADEGRVGFENTIIIQAEEVVQEGWDTARRLSCDWPDRVEKLVTFRPIAVRALEATEARFAGDDITCWMDIQLGRGPFASSVDGIVRIGEQLTVVILAQATAGQMDMAVTNCYTYDAENISDPRTTVLQLTDDRGCLLKPKLMNYFRKTRQTGSTGADILSFAAMSAFKFPDRMDVYLACEVEFCKDSCQQTCDSEDAPRGLEEDAEDSDEDTEDSEADRPEPQPQPEPASFSALRLRGRRPSPPTLPPPSRATEAPSRATMPQSQATMAQPRVTEAPSLAMEVPSRATEAPSRATLAQSRATEAPSERPPLYNYHNCCNYHYHCHHHYRFHVYHHYRHYHFYSLYNYLYYFDHHHYRRQL